LDLPLNDEGLQGGIYLNHGLILSPINVNLRQARDRGLTHNTAMDFTPLIDSAPGHQIEAVVIL
jgi:hypothetical protein